MSDDCILVYNAAIWCSGQADNEWMIFNQSSGLVIDVGRNAPPRDQFHEEHRKINCQGRRIFPGFIDAHIHISSLGESLEVLDLYGTRSIDELKTKLKNYVEQHPGLQRVIGLSWEQDLLGRYPCKEDLDEICSDIPVILHRICLHILVCNSKALQLAGISKDTPDPDDGEIDRYPADHEQAGQLTGVLREGAANVMKNLTEPTPEDSLRFLEQGLNECLRNGTTCVQSIEKSTWAECCLLADTGRLPIRMYYSADYTFRDQDGFPAAGARCGSFLLCDRVKLFTDGSLGSQTAALSLPYQNTQQYGILMYSQEELTRLIHQATSRGYRLEIHAIGDHAAEVALDALETAQVAPDRRPILTHCQVLREDILHRMVERGVIANMQPQMVSSDSRWSEQCLPGDLSNLALAIKTVLQKGIICAGGSDAPVETPEPLRGIYNAIFRPHGIQGRGEQRVYLPNERLSLREAVDIYTKGGAYAAMREHDLGQLLPGYHADFVLIDSDVDVCDHPEAFLTASVAQVWVNGHRRI